MFEHKMLQSLNGFFDGLNQRQGKSVYFYRINGYSEEIKGFIQTYYEAARKSGIVLEGKIPNPDEKNLSYYEEIMGMDFQMSIGFINSGLKKWLPRMNEIQRNNVAVAIYDTLDIMGKEGKNDNMLKNAYIKFMCWLYYKFERILNQLGENKVPKILYEGEISNYELKLITILSCSGCDVVLLQYNGDRKYLELDPGSNYSYNYQTSDMAPFPLGFSVAWLRKEMEQQQSIQRLYGTKSQVAPCTNGWIEGKGLPDMEKPSSTRGPDPNMFYNCFCRINGVEDKLTYLNEIYQFQLQLKNSKRKILILENTIPQPTMEEIRNVQRGNYRNQDEMLIGLSNNISYSANIELQRLMVQSFIDIILEESKEKDMNLNRLTNKAIYLVCWLKRYQPQLFQNWKMPEISFFVYLGGCKNENEAMLLRFLARLPIDVLILNPDLNHKCCLESPLLYEINYSESLTVDRFPRENSDIHMGTAAYHAERELDTVMYQDSGIYRNQQYEKAVSVTLQTMYEEIAILWDQELKYRPNFSVVESIVNIPVVFAKVSGVKDGAVPKYWSNIKALRTEDTFVIKNAPYIQATDANPIKSSVSEFFKNGKLQKAKIKGHKFYSYSFLREEMQDHILDKLELLLEQKTIKGTFENGTEYTIIAVALNLHKELVRLIQKFDFTKKNPKLIYINTSESIISLEDSILTAFLNLVGFDVVFFVPTGYQSIEKFFNKHVMEEHQAGDYIYDLQPPNFDMPSSTTRQSWREKIFKRGN